MAKFRPPDIKQTKTKALKLFIRVFRGIFILVDVFCNSNFSFLTAAFETAFFRLYKFTSVTKNQQLVPDTWRLASDQ